MATKNPRNEKLIIKFGENVRKQRISKDLTMLQLALMCDVELGAISTIERGKVNCSISTAYSIATALEVSVDDLLK
ncbi:transcriptional regulator [Pedobacter yonginense]|uniref:Transcriptional regulator n=1 Tax=Pedobacter yonginense TaxID=651869 RepID=A0A317EPV4_9SPHI|nr:helix-turn-helix transcriptional regulator [Pedobacter yonginense]PWS27959.1 transcriptional regulator [Pedobacter yonginense]